MKAQITKKQASYEELLAAFQAAKNNLNSFRAERFKKESERLTAEFGKGITVDTENSDGLCDTFHIFGSSAVDTFYYIGRESLESILAEQGFDNLHILNEDGEVYHFISSEHTVTCKRSNVM